MKNRSRAFIIFAITVLLLTFATVFAVAGEELTESADTQYKVQSVGGEVVSYATGETTLSALLTGASAGDVITVYQDTALGAQTSAVCSASVTVDLMGNTLNTDSYIVPSDDAHIVIRNGTVNVTTRELAQMSEYYSQDAILELSNVTVKREEKVSAKNLFDTRVGRIVMNKVTINDGEWALDDSIVTLITVGFRSRVIAQPIEIEVDSCDINLPKIHFISTSGATGETNGYALDVDIKDSTVKAATSVIKVAPPSTSAPNCSFDLSIEGKSAIISTGTFTNHVIFDISTLMTASKVRVFADYGVEFSRYPRLAVGNLILGDGDAMLDVKVDNGYGVVTDLWADNYTPVTDYAYSFCVVGDTQMTTDYDPANLHHIYDWIVSNKNGKKIQYVFGMGDITNHSADDEWQIAYNEISKLNGVVDYALVRGNHDTTEGLNATFNNEQYKSMFDGFMSEGQIENSYVAFTVGEVKYLHITLDYQASDTVLAWAGSVIENYKDHRVIISTHSYLNADATLVSTGGSSDGTSNNGSQMWNKLVSQYENVFLVLSGHVFSTDLACLQSKGVHGNTVTQLMTNGQTLDYRNFAMGLVSMLYFSEDGKTVTVEYYSTVHDKYLGAKNQFTLTIPEYNGEGADYLYSVKSSTGLTAHYGSSYKFSEIMTSCVSDGSTVTLHGNVKIDTGFRLSCNVSIDLNGYTISTDSGKMSGSNKTVNISNGNIEITNNEILYVGDGYTSFCGLISNVKITHTTAAPTKVFVDMRGGELTLDNVTVADGAWGGATGNFITVGYKTKTQSQISNITIKNSSINLGQSASNLTGFTSQADEVNGWIGNVSIINSYIATNGYIVQAKPNSQTAKNSGFNILFDGKTTLECDNCFNIDEAIPKENIKLTLGVGAKIKEFPSVSGVSAAYRDGVLVYDSGAGYYTVLTKTDAEGGEYGCKLVRGDGSPYLYFYGNSFTSEIVVTANNSGCNIVLLTDMVTPSGTSTQAKYAIKAATLDIDLNGKTLSMSAFACFTTDANTVLSIHDGVVRTVYTVFYSYSGNDEVTSFTASNVKFVSNSTYATFDHRIGILTLVDCTVEYEKVANSEALVFTLGYVNNATNKVKVNITRSNFDALGPKRSIFKLYGGRPVTVYAEDCSFTVGSSAYVVTAVSSYSTDQSDLIKFTDCEFYKDGEVLVNTEYTDISITSADITAPTCTEQGYTTTTDMITGTVTKGNYTEPLSHTRKITGASINFGRTLAMVYYVEVCECTDISDCSMRFTMNGKTVTVSESKEVDGKYTFTFSNIPPQCMGDNISAELVLGDTVVARKDTHSIKENAEYLLSEYKTDSAIVALVNDILNYGAAAQLYRNYKTDSLVTDTDTTEDIKPEKTDMSLTDSLDDSVKITAAGVWFDYNNRIYIKFTAEDVTGVTVKIDGKAVNISENEGGGYIVYTDSISATDFARIYTVELQVGGQTVQTLTYSVNSYAYAKWDSENMSSLARALYAYGISAIDYVSSRD